MGNTHSKEIIKMSKSLNCGHCGAIFVGSISQARKVKYEKKTVYCSKECRSAGHSQKLSKPIPERGPCKQCGEMYKSRTAKIYCSMSCYTKSDQFKETRLLASAKAKTVNEGNPTPEELLTGNHVNCLECGVEFYKALASKRKYCSRQCYRAYMSKRFDRWVADPQSISLPQCYDEFLDKERLNCIVDGCNWEGEHLEIT
jgi:hypothetical protein